MARKQYEDDPQVLEMLQGAEMMRYLIQTRFGSALEASNASKALGWERSKSTFQNYQADGLNDSALSPLYITQLSELFNIHKNWLWRSHGVPVPPPGTERDVPPEADPLIAMARDARDNGRVEFFNTMVTTMKLLYEAHKKDD